ncbi:EscF/YscF/HrpA family type III secretion system needle major subunit [Stenotrophomonas sp. NPDC077659]|uniref:EscF/YscF/HrpA family type III secretion system needle major subunit n=1 Tax=Stenotrophomonas sp. NPDC077659 TaxID=3390694 RepID=UPI003D017F57
MSTLVTNTTGSTINAHGDFGDPGLPGGSGANWGGWMSKHAQAFDTGVSDLKAKLDDAFAELKKDPGSPILLGAYQSALSEYNMYRMLQSNSTKSLTDQSKSVIRNLA